MTRIPPVFRPVSVQKRHGRWEVLDLGGGQRDWDGSPLAVWPSCCHARAVFVADRVANNYRLRRPDYVVAPGLPHPPHRGVGKPCERAPVAS